MNQEKQPTIPDYSNSKRKEVPDSFKWKTTDIYPDAAAWEKDKQVLLDMMEQIEEKKADWTSSPTQMADLMTHVDEMTILDYKLYVYTSLLSDTDIGDSAYQAMKGEIKSIDVDLDTMLTFMDPDIIKLGEKKIREYVAAEPRLKVYEFTFGKILRLKKHILPSDKAEIVSRTGLFSGTPGKAAGMLNDLDIPSPRITLSDGEKIRLNTAAYGKHRGAENRADRLKVMRTFWRHRGKFQNTHAALLDGAMKHHYFSAKTHHYKGCLEAALCPGNIDLDVYYNLIETVKANLGPFHRYLELKGRFLELDRMEYDDIYASSIPAVEKTYTIEEAKELILEAMKPLGSDYTATLKQGFDSGWMDLYPNKGKRSGAYSQGSLYGLHPFVLMNYNGKFQHVSTLAHEYGHALHSWYSNKTQPFPVARYPIFLAEIASTFNENLLTEHLLETEKDDKMKLYLLDQMLESYRGTLYRQTLFADFELAMHRRAEKGQTLTPEWLNKNYLKLTRLFYGHRKKTLHVGKHIETEWSYIPHFYYNFYVYQYSTGIIASTVLSEMVLEGGEAERKRYLDFLSAGGSRYPLDTLKEAGVDLTDPGPIEKTIAKFDGAITQMEEILKRQ